MRYWKNTEEKLINSVASFEISEDDLTSFGYVEMSKTNWKAERTAIINANKHYYISNNGKAVIMDRSKPFYREGNIYGRRVSKEEFDAWETSEKGRICREARNVIKRSAELESDKLRELAAMEQEFIKHEEVMDVTITIDGIPWYKWLNREKSNVKTYAEQQIANAYATIKKAVWE